MKKVAFVDSGFGGLLLASHIHKNFPELEIFYFGDTKNMPYGEKKIEFLNERYKVFQQKAKENNIDLLVVACNTLSATSFQTEEKLVNTVDIISISVDYINCKNNEDKIEKLALVATPNTINSKIYQKTLNGEIKIQEVPAKSLASLIENDTLENVGIEFKKLIGSFDGNILLGCTHYSVLSSLYSNLNMISQDVVLDEYLRVNFNLKKEEKEMEKSIVKLFVNAELEKYKKFAKKLFNKGEFEINLLDF